MIDYKNVPSGQQATRAYWRVMLKGDALDLHFLTGNPLTSWPDRVEDWRKAVDEGKAEVAAVTSSAAVTEGAQLVGARAVVDVHILGAETGETVGVIARRLDSLTGNIDVASVELVTNSDPIAREAALRQAAQQSHDPLGLDKYIHAIQVVLVLGLALAGVYVAAQAYKAVRK